MKLGTHLFSVWESVRASYWFVPSSMSLGSIILAFLMIWIDSAMADELLRGAPWLYTGTADGARTLLATIASSMIGLAGVVFSITIVALTLASGQFGPRLLRNFMRDRGNQITLGTFLSAFLYCLLILREVKGSDGISGGAFVPQLSLLLAVIIATAGLAVLIYFIHHIAESIQAPNVIAGVANELGKSMRTMYPEKLGTGPETTDEIEANALAQVPPQFVTSSARILADTEGYVLRVDSDELMRVTQDEDLIVRVERRPGQFVQIDDAVFLVWPCDRAEGAVRDRLRKAFTIADQRSLSQDVEFAVDQLVEVAVRALSSGINDPFTAIQCVDRLGAALSELAGRRIPSPYRMDEEGKLRVIAPAKTFEEFLATSFNQLRQYAAQSLDVLMWMMQAMERIARRTSRRADKQHLSNHANLVYELAIAAAKSDQDRLQVERRYASIQEVLEED